MGFKGVFECDGVLNGVRCKTIFEDETTDAGADEPHNWAALTMRTLLADDGEEAVAGSVRGEMVRRRRNRRCFRASLCPACSRRAEEMIRTVVHLSDD